MQPLARLSIFVVVVVVAVVVVVVIMFSCYPIMIFSSVKNL